MTVATDGKGNYFTQTQDGEWVPTQLRKDELGAEMVRDGDEWKPLPARKPEHYTGADTDPPPSLADYSGVSLPAGPDLSSIIRNALAPAPNTTYGSVLPLAKDNTTGKIRLALPEMIRAPLIGLTEQGPQVVNGNLQAPAATINPDTGTLGVTPEAASVATFAASPTRFSRGNALMREPQSPLTLTKPPPVTLEELNAAISRADQAPPREPAIPTITVRPQEPGATGAGEPQPGMGPRAAGAQGTPANLAGMTPEQIVSHRSQADQTWLQSTNQPGIANDAVLVPGVNPTLAQIEQKVATSRELKSLSTRSTEVSQEERALADEHNLARQNSYTSDIAGGGQVVLDNLKQARKDQLQTDYPAAFKNKQPTAPIEGLAATEEILNAPRALENTALKKYVAPLLERMKDITDAERLYGLREDIRRMASKASQADDRNLEHVAGELETIIRAVDKDIERGASGYRNYMDNYAEASHKIDAMEALLERAPKLESSQGHIQFSKFHNLMRDIVEAQKPGAARSPWQHLTDDQMRRLKNMHDDLKRVATAEDLARAKGSDTAQNAWDMAKGVGGQAALHTVANVAAPVVGSVALGFLKQATDPIFGAFRQAKDTRRGLEMLHPPRNDLVP